MSDSQVNDRVTISSENITVTKRFEEDEFPVPAIAFELTSSRTEDVRVELKDAVPDGIAVGDLGFHPEYGSEYWTIEDDVIKFERKIAAGATYTTVYGIRATGTDNIDQFLTEPDLEVTGTADSSDDLDDIVPDQDTETADEMISSDDVPDLKDTDDVNLDLEEPGLRDDTEEAVADMETPEGEPEESEEAVTDPSQEGSTEEEIVTVEGSLTSRLAREIKQQEVSGEDIKFLRRTLELAGHEGGSTAAVIDQLQSDIADLRAYTNAMEEFLDENGTGEQLIEGFSEEIEGVNQEVEDFRETLDAFDSRLKDVQGTIDSNREELDDLGSEVTEMSEEVNSVTERVETVDEEVGGIGEQVESVSSDVTDVEADLDELDGAIDGIESKIDALESEVPGGDLSGRIEDMEEEVADLREWQEQIKQTFGG